MKDPLHAVALEISNFRRLAAVNFTTLVTIRRAIILFLWIISISCEKRLC
jgi:hypothetical protein